MTRCFFVERKQINDPAALVEQLSIAVLALDPRSPGQEVYAVGDRCYTSFAVGLSGFTWYELSYGIACVLADLDSARKGPLCLRFNCSF